MKSSVRLSRPHAKSCSSASGVQSCPKGPLQNGEGWISMVYSNQSPLSSSIQLEKKKWRAASNVVYLRQECSFISAQIRKSTHSVLRHVETVVTAHLGWTLTHTQTLTRGHTSAQTTPHCERECAADWIIQEKAKNSCVSQPPSAKQSGTQGEWGSGNGWERRAFNSTQSRSRKVFSVHTEQRKHKNMLLKRSRQCRGLSRVCTPSRSPS